MFFMVIAINSTIPALDMGGEMIVSGQWWVLKDWCMAMFRHLTLSRIDILDKL